MITGLGHVHGDVFDAFDDRQIGLFQFDSSFDLPHRRQLRS